MIPTIVAALIFPFIKGITALLSFISNNAFPQPLSEKDEADCLCRLREGDEAARQKLIEHNLRLVAHLVKKFDGTGENNDDLISIGTIGLIKAINTFDAGKGTKLATYAARCIENEILMHLRAMKKCRGEVSLYDPIGVDKEGNEITLIDILGTEPDSVADVVENALEQARVLERLKKLSKRERYVVELRFGLLSGCRQTQREIARNLGISRSYVSRIEKRAVGKLMKEMCVNESKEN
ncbi:RNA polymerase sporulation sigma factor SigK [Heliophilum fasciatum]|uniref:RNA polymerase sigma factor n=1 Tax=Heliophilum fasciatum TaxID=35700 RepID=A0A4R2RUR7_9FIRM|nr:RNA polymerase sporulation sigma factor SigK [Heliophilum fasciatum]MCW2277297.1 RNA polymerase sporulation-specific sigma factor [Heliophilum fasciatum]TCP67134.1 RNA polymerase sigma-27/28 (RpsK/SigK) subunit [Heliophilum fasciatum]